MDVAIVGSPAIYHQIDTAARIRYQTAGQPGEHRGIDSAKHLACVRPLQIAGDQQLRQGPKHLLQEHIYLDRDSNGDLRVAQVKNW